MMFFSGKTLKVQLIALGASGIILLSCAATAALSLDPGEAMPVLISAAIASLVVIVIGVRHILSPMDQLRETMMDLADGRADVIDPITPAPDLANMKLAYQRLIARIGAARQEHEDARRVLARRKKTVDHLLEFSQTIQGAGKSEQIFAALTHYLRHELDLAGVTVLGHELDAVPPIQIRSCWPQDLMRADVPVHEMDASLCPCLRQSLPKCFRSDGSPVRCAVDASLTLSAAHPAYCIPFTIGRRTQVLVHMLLPIGATWTEELRQVAQTYVNAAHSSLILLNMLAEAEQQSMTDSLTGLYNRRSLDQLLQREVALSERHDHPLALVMIDMDNFKQMNDSHGHAAGDYILKSFADCVRITLRKTDLAFRYGGDEFVIALPQTSIDQAKQVVTKVKQAFSSVDFSSAIANLEDHPTLSIGVAERCKQTGVLTLAQLLAAADAALYDAKNSNRNCIRVYEANRAA